MPSSVIKIEHLYKEYRLGTIGYGTLRKDLESGWARFRGKPDPNSIIGNENGQNLYSDRILALNNINLEVKRGEVLGIIGKNGAGKTTLLKILSRIASPTKGSVKIKGRVASLIAIGTGFHEELTGRENIYLNGSILGLRKFEIDQRFDEIVDFSGVEQFIDTPVKRYSSGMYVRLGFAVAAHLEPAVLIVDEVLAVGDADFQKKALGKMKKVSHDEGRTILFVSHNMGMITSLCKNAILLENGKLKYHGTASDSVRKYLSKGDLSPFKVDFTKYTKTIGDEFSTLLSASIQDLKGNEVGTIDIREPFKISMRYELSKNIEVKAYPEYHFYDERGECLFVISEELSSIPKGTMGIYEAECIIDGNFFNNGTFFVGLTVALLNNGKTDDCFFERDALCFSIIDPIEETLFQSRNGYSGPYPGPLRPKFKWNVRKLRSL